MFGCLFSFLSLVHALQLSRPSLLLPLYNSPVRPCCRYFLRVADATPFFKWLLLLIQMVRLTGLLNIGVLSVIVLLTVFLARGSKLILIVGWICLGSVVSVFATPLPLIGNVIRTMGAEFMPLPLSLFLTLSASTWTVNGVVIGDIHISLASALGFVLGVVQIMLYMIFRNVPRSDESQELQGVWKERDSVGAHQQLISGHSVDALSHIVRNVEGEADSIDAEI